MRRIHFGITCSHWLLSFDNAIFKSSVPHTHAHIYSCIFFFHWLWRLYGRYVAKVLVINWLLVHLLRYSDLELKPERSSLKVFLSISIFIDTDNDFTEMRHFEESRDHLTKIFLFRKSQKLIKRDRQTKTNKQKHLPMSIIYFYFILKWEKNTTTFLSRLIYFLLDSDSYQSSTETKIP